MASVSPKTARAEVEELSGGGGTRSGESTEGHPEPRQTEGNWKADPAQVAHTTLLMQETHREPRNPSERP